jgi:mono/diheme cytochrome c family protein
MVPGSIARTNCCAARRRPFSLSPCLLVSLSACVFLTGCTQKMAQQPKYHWPDMPSDFFPDGRATRPIEPDTVARGQLREDALRFTGQTAPGKPDAPAYATEFPYPVTPAMLSRGRERFNIYCAVCHGRTGYGDGQVVQRGYLKPPSYHDQRLRDMPVGRFYEVITRGFGGMPDYAEQIPTDDRWAIIAYIRALQLSQNVPAGELPEAERSKLREADEKKQPGAEGDRGH